MREKREATGRAAVVIRGFIELRDDDDEEGKKRLGRRRLLVLLCGVATQ